MSSLTDEQQQKLWRVANDLPYYAEHILKIKNKEGKIVPFILNREQKYIHKRIEEQRKLIGRVRAIILKSRQQGASTYIGGRYYQKTSKHKGKNTFILSHDSESTKNLFAMPKLYYDKETETLKTPLKKSNATELIFEELNSQYRVGTAGNAEIGRSMTNQNFHGSEVAFWKNAEKIAAGVMETIPDMPNTEIILESTANGMGNYFHDMVTAALTGKSEYIIIFIPWYWTVEYQMEPESGFIPTEDEQKIIDNYLQEFTPSEQLAKIKWRRNKIFSKFGGKDYKFKQEYPTTIHEAFLTTGDSLISPESILKARENKTKDKNAPLIMGVDPARGGGDRTVIAFRRGREMPIYYSYDKMEPMRLVGIVARYIDKHSPVMINFDVAEGSGPVDRLKELGYDNVNAVHFNSRALDDKTYFNIRAEMWCNLRDWVAADANIPDDDDLQADLMCVPDYKERSDSKIKLESKEKIKQEYGRSPDIGDAMALTLVYPVRRKKNNVRPVGKNRAKWKHKGQRR